MSDSMIEKMILDRDNDYLAPYFYNYKNSLRCELGKGDDRAVFRKAAEERAGEIFNILFPSGADAFFFSYWHNDWVFTGDADGDVCTAHDVDRIVADEGESLRFLLECERRYRHAAVRDVALYDEEDRSTRRRDRIVFYKDDRIIDEKSLIRRQIEEDGKHEISLVSFENECILSVYDDRGCDVVFSNTEKMRKFYPLLKPYFLPYDEEEMERRYLEN